MNDDYRKSGYLLIEAAVSLAILCIAFGGIFTLLSHSLSLNKVISANYIGSFLAAEGIEIVKNIIDTNYINFRPWNEGIFDGTYQVDYNSESLEPFTDNFLKHDPNTRIYSYDSGEETIFKRKIEIENISPDEVKINSRVYWNIKGGRYEVNSESHFFNWRP